MEKTKSDPEKRESSFPAHGWIALDKPPGLSSARAVAVMKRLLGGIRTGHGGTLDPLATGVLPIAFGAATRTTECLLTSPKSYSFDVRWGLSTTTDDAWGQPLLQSGVRPSLADIQQALPSFRGDIQQIPPAYSALKLQGERAYRRALRGEEVCLEPRCVTLYEFTWLEHLDLDHDRFKITCSRGTYVRSLARDLGIFLGTLAHVTALRRTSWGPFQEKDTRPLDYFRELGHIPDNSVVPIAAVLTSLPKIVCRDEEIEAICHGRSIQAKLEIAAGEKVALFFEDKVGALGFYENGMVQPWRVFESLNKKKVERYDDR